jgi:hypothetical protein
VAHTAHTNNNINNVWPTRHTPNNKIIIIISVGPTAATNIYIKYQINIINNLRPTWHANTNNLNTIRGPHGARKIINKYNNVVNAYVGKCNINNNVVDAYVGQCNIIQ